MISIGDWKGFTAEHLDRLLLAFSDGVVSCEAFTKELNRILEEKLKGATEVFEISHPVGKDHLWVLECCVDKRGGDIVHSTARLVNIQEVRK